MVRSRRHHTRPQRAALLAPTNELLKPCLSALATDQLCGTGRYDRLPAPQRPLRLTQARCPEANLGQADLGQAKLGQASVGWALQLTHLTGSCMELICEHVTDIPQRQTQGCGPAYGPHPGHLHRAIQHLGHCTVPGPAYSV